MTLAKESPVSQKAPEIKPIEQTEARSLFAELIAQARTELGQRPSEPATGYLVDLLLSRVRAPVPPAPTASESLAATLLGALHTEGSMGRHRLRELGDRTLFDAGFFGDSLRWRAVGVSYYRDIGCTAYARLSSSLSDGSAKESPEAGGSGSLFRELATHFGSFVELLAEVGMRARGTRDVDLLSLYERYRATGSARDRARLLRHGLIPPAGRGGERIQ